MPPMPKRSAERRRRNKEGRAEKVETAGALRVPACPKGAHALARRWYLSLKDSAQSQYYEPSDWAEALLIVEQWTRLLASPDPVPASAFAALWSAMGELLSSEGARRRARLEVERKPEAMNDPSPGITKLAEFRRKAGA